MADFAADLSAFVAKAQGNTLLAFRGIAAAIDARVKELTPVGATGFLRASWTASLSPGIATVSPATGGGPTAGPAPGFTRLYHGAPDAASAVQQSAFGRHVTSDLKYAQGYASGAARGVVTGVGAISFVDLPTEHPLIKPEYENESIKMGFHVMLSLPADISNRMQLLIPGGSSATVADSIDVIGSAALGDTIYLLNPAVYARRIEYGFVGTDKRGRSYNQQGRYFVAQTVAETPALAEGVVVRIQP